MSNAPCSTLSGLSAKYHAFYSNPTGVKTVGLIGSSFENFVLTLSAKFIFSTLSSLPSCVGDVPFTDMPYIDYKVSRVKFMSVSPLEFYVRVFDLDVVIGEIFSSISLIII